MKRLWIPLVALVLVGAGCSTGQGSISPTTKGPWDGSLLVSTSSDGMEFTTGDVILERAGVPNLLQLPDETIVLTYQYFSPTDEELFDAIAYSLSRDNGKSWSKPKALHFENLPEPLDEKKVPMDPTLVRAENGSLRMYFTYHAKGMTNASLYVAVAADGKIDSPFVAQDEPVLSIPQMNVLDPAVVYFDGMWHHYTWKDGDDVNYHSTSIDGLTFTLQDDVELPMDFLGQVIAMDGGLRFYGTGRGVVSAFSEDGSDWAMESGSRAEGVDPGVIALEDGGYLMVSTSLNFNE